MSKFKIGIATVEYKPDIGLPIMGHIRDDYAARAVHDPLLAKAMVIASAAGEKIALLSIDICMMPRDEIAKMREFIEAECSLPGKNVLIAATHTHGGPSTISKYTSPKSPNDKIKAFLERAAQAVIDANNNLENAIINIGYAEEGRLSFNRRLKCRDGQTHMNWEGVDPAIVIEALGPIDSRLVAMKVESKGRPKAVLVNFPLHPAVIDYENFDYTADWPGYMADGLAKIVGDDFVSLFFNGCCGNINHIDYSNKNTPRRGFAMSQLAGYMLAADAAKAMRNEVAISGQRIAVSRELVRLKRFRISKQEYESAKRALKSRNEMVCENSDGLPAKYIAPGIIEMYDNQNEEDHVEVMVLRIGDVGIVGLPGEIFCEFGLEIKEKSPAKHTIVIELANDAIGYIPTVAAFDQGGYEVTTGVTSYQKGSGERLVESAVSQLNELFK